jgi:hypothetical protein
MAMGMEGHATGLISSYICIFMTILLNTCFSHQPKRKGRKRHIYMMWCIKNCTHVCCTLYLSSHHRPMWSTVFLSQTFLSYLEKQMDQHITGSFCTGCKKKLGFKPKIHLRTAENNTGLTAQ